MQLFCENRSKDSKVNLANLSVGKGKTAGHICTFLGNCRWNHTKIKLVIIDSIVWKFHSKVIFNVQTHIKSKNIEHSYYLNELEKKDFTFAQSRFWKFFTKNQSTSFSILPRKYLCFSWKSWEIDFKKISFVVQNIFHGILASYQ